MLLLGIGADPVLDDNAGPGFTVMLTNVSAVPEPSTLFLVGASALLAVVITCRRNRATV